MNDEADRLDDPPEQEGPNGSQQKSELPPGTRVIHNPSAEEQDEVLGHPEDSELLERHGKRFHLIGRSRRMAIEVIRYVERQKGLLKKSELVEDRTIYMLPEGVDLMEARRIGYRLLERQVKGAPDET